jgi:hypothetical protein
MSTGPAHDERSSQELRWALTKHEDGDYRQVGSSRFAAAAREPAFARVTSLFVAIARIHRLLAVGDLYLAEEGIGSAVTRLPDTLRCPSTRTRVLLPPDLGSGGIEIEVPFRAARVLWREQSELDDLRARAAEMSAGDALLEAFIEQLTWTFCDPHHVAALVAGRGRGGSNGAQIERTREAICLRATHLRQFGRPDARSIGPSTWQALDGYEGLLAAALDRFGARTSSVPWWDPAREDTLPWVRPGRRLAWNLAKGLRDGR